MHWEQKKKKKGIFQVSSRPSQRAGHVPNFDKKQTKSQTHSDMKNQNEVRVTDPHLLPHLP